MPKRPANETAKERITKIIARLPDDSSFDEGLRELRFVRMIDRGVRDADAGRVVGHAEVVRQSKSWSR
jgi:predicted transcriptional regulator